MNTRVDRAVLATSPIPESEPAPPSFASSPGAPPMSQPGDRIMRDVEATGSAQTPYVAALLQAQSAASSLIPPQGGDVFVPPEAAGAPFAGLDESELARLVSSFPAEMRTAFVAQLAASGIRLRTAVGADDADSTVSERNVAAPVAVRAGDSSAGGAAAAVLAAHGYAPETTRTDARKPRKQGEQRRRSDLTPPQESADTADDRAGSTDKPGYTIDDIVKFGDVTVAQRQTSPSALS